MKNSFYNDNTVEVDFKGTMVRIAKVDEENFYKMLKIRGIKTKKEKDKE